MTKKQRQSARLKGDSSIQGLLKSAKQRGEENRNALSEKLARLAQHHNQQLSDFSMSDLFALLSDTIQRIEMDLRAQLANILAENTECPKSLIRFLSNDHISIATPIILKSPLLEESDLLEIVYHRGQEHRLAMAQRGKLPYSVSDELAKSGEEASILALLNNKDVKLKNKTIEYLVEESRRYTSLQRPLVNRAELGPNLAMKLAVYASAAIREEIIQRFDLDSEILENAIQESELKVNKKLRDIMAEWGKTDDLAASLIRRSKVTVQDLPSLLRAGEIGLFISAFRYFTGLSKILAGRFLYEEGAEALAVVCKAIEMSEENYIELHHNLAGAKYTEKLMQLKIEKKHTVNIFRNIPAPTAKNMLEYWQSDSDYLYARNTIRDHLHCFVQE